MKRAKKKPARKAASAITNVNGKRGVHAGPKTERAIKKWKQIYIEHKKLELSVDLARSVVKGEFDALGADVIVSPTLGPIALQHRTGRTVTDWEALARKLLPAELIEQHVEAFTTQGAETKVLAAPSAWSAEASM